MQVDGYSLDAQRDKLRKYAAYEDMIVAGEYSDEGFSGKNIQGRQEFQRMLNDIQDGKDDVSYVLVFKLSRFGRNAADVLNSLQLMQDFGVNLICVEDGERSAREVHGDIFDGEVQEGMGGTENLPETDVLLEIRNLHFSYEDKHVLEGLRLSIGAGQHVAVLGPSGCGKTTLLRIICGFYRCGRGQVFFRGRDINDWKPEELRGHLSLVSQQAGLLRGSVSENVSAMAEAVGEEEVRAALSTASAWEFVTEMENGTASDVGESGNRLSGGQKQRIALARAFYKDAELMILDEPTSALDLVTEQEIKRTMMSMLQGRGALIITHRTALVSDVDYIYCMDEQGRIREEGSPGELMDRRGYYYHIVKAENQSAQGRVPKDA